MIHHGDCLDVMAAMDPESVDAIVTDPPYGLGFMGKHWDHGVPAIEFWREMLRVAKPSAYLLSFGGTRTVHRIATLIEDAGWIIRDMLVWGYASGFPKSKASLKPAWEPIVMARKPGPLRMLNIDACRLPVSGPTAIMDAWDDERSLCGSCAVDAANRARPGAQATRASTTRKHAELTLNDWATSTGTDRPDTGCSDGTTADDTATSLSTDASGRKPTGRSQRATSFITSTGIVATTGLKTCRSCGVTSMGTTTIDDTTFTPSGLREPTTPGDTALGRWPANLALTDPIFDGGWEGVVGGGADMSHPAVVRNDTAIGGYHGTPSRKAGTQLGYPDEGPGTYSRFFIIPKADRSDREPVLGGLPTRVVNITEGHGLGPVNTSKGGDGIRENRPRANVHPTVKPTDLMRHLVRLVTPTGGTVLDPFLGSGTTALAAEMEGFDWIGIEREAEYVAIAEARLNGTQRGLGLEAS